MTLTGDPPSILLNAGTTRNDSGSLVYLSLLSTLNLPRNQHGSDGGMVVGHHEGPAGHDLVRRPRMAVDESHAVHHQPRRGPYPDPAGQELLYLGIVVPADHGDLREALQERLEEVRDLRELLLGGAGDRVLYVPYDDQLIYVLVRGRDY